MIKSCELKKIDNESSLLRFHMKTQTWTLGLWKDDHVQGTMAISWHWWHCSSPAVVWNVCVLLMQPMTMTRPTHPSLFICTINTHIHMEDVWKIIDEHPKNNIWNYLNLFLPKIDSSFSPSRWKASQKSPFFQNTSPKKELIRSSVSPQPRSLECN